MTFPGFAVSFKRGGRQLLPLLAIALTSLGAAQTPPRIQSLISAANLDGMRWPNFRDYQPWLQKFYEPVNYSPAWVNGNSPSPQALAMIELFRNSWKKGLEPEDYDASRWDSRLRAMQGSAADPAGLDVALTVSAMRYISDLRVGRINPQHFKFGLSVEQKKYDLAQFLRERLLPATDPSAVVDSVEPPFPGYRRAEQALARYIELARADDGEKIPVPVKPVDPGQAYPGVARLAVMLRLVGDLPPDTAQPVDSQLYDGALVEAVKRFQRRHGLDADGRLGPSTVNQLNVPLSARVHQLKLTLERWRWLPTEFAAPPIVVNIPDFRLRALDENNKIALEMRVVVGRAMRGQTPVFSRDMTYVVLRPYWNIPPGILRRDVIPAIKRDRNQVASKNYEITAFDGKVVTSGEVSDEVLAQLEAGKLTVRQKPGPNNALGLIKLMFPNEYHVYLHSTPATELFSRSRRDFSAGCIRVEKPAELAAWVLRYNSGWTVERVRQGMLNGKDDATVGLARRVPVFIVYGTAVAYENDEVHFYDDIYGHDAKLAEALAKGYPYP
ncbi:MAG TPA: L,D-transpeptidase family protein [Candidatus Angelobacter sp.]|nr:L,D-transpeptidase family protein [Candidatus Angelobacter sp.]